MALGPSIRKIENGNRSDIPLNPKMEQAFYYRDKTEKWSTLLKVLLLVIVTNLVTFYAFSSGTRLTEFDYSSFIHELSGGLAACRSLVHQLRNEGVSSKGNTLKLELHTPLSHLSSEAKLALGNHKLPNGYNPRMGSEIAFSYGAGCVKHKEELEKFMSYEVGGECPMDEVSAQNMMLRGCEPLPRRRCHPKSPKNYVEPSPLPKSLWSIPPDTSVVWDSYTCKNYTCLRQMWRDKQIYFDCNDCFDLERREGKRWLHDRGIEYGMDQVLALKPHGTIRIGVDIGGGSGTFAARMMERNVTIITTTMNLDGPFNSFIASRGLLSMHISISQRLPFFENTLDIVHSMHVLSNWIPGIMLEFILYHIYRILRPGGLFWLDHFFCSSPQLEETYAPVLKRVGFNILRWNVGKKTDNPALKNQVYLSAVFEKPME